MDSEDAALWAYAAMLQRKLKTVVEPVHMLFGGVGQPREEPSSLVSVEPFVPGLC